MTIEIASLVVLGVVFLIATVSSIHLGLLALAAAYVVGVLFGGLDFDDVTKGFPVNIFVLLLGVTYLFTIVKDSGAIEWVINRTLKLVRGNIGVLPWIFFLLGVGLASLGSPLIGAAMLPIAMIFADQHKLDPVLMALAVIISTCAGGFSPISLYGLITNGVAEANNIETHPMFLYGAAVGLACILMTIAFVMFGGVALLRNETRSGAVLGSNAPHAAPNGVVSDPSGTGNGTAGLEGGVATQVSAEPSIRADKLTTYQAVSLLSLLALMVSVIVLTAFDLPVDVGAIALGLGVLLSLVYGEQTKTALKGVDWSTILLVGGIVTYVGVLQAVGSVDLLGDAAKSIDQPILAALVLCLVAAFVSAFASTTGILGALIPLAVPLLAAGSFTGYGLIVAIALSSSLVDATPFSTAGAISVASSPEEERPRVSRILMRWGLSMIVIAPVVTVVAFVLPSM